MTELRQAREVDMVPEELRYVPQVKSDIIIQRRNVTLAPIEASDEYTRTGTNTITFNIQGHRELSQLLDTKSMYFTWHSKFNNAYPVEDVGMLVEEVIISSNGRVIERIRHAQYIQHFVRGYGMSRKSKARLGDRAGFMRFEDRTVQFDDSGGNNGFSKQTTTALAAIQTQAQGAGGLNDGYKDYVDSQATWANTTRMSENLGYKQNQINRTAAAIVNGAGPGVGGGLANVNWGGGSNQAHNATEAAQYHLQKFRLHCSGLLSSDKMLPIGFMPLTIQLRLSDPARATDNSYGGFTYTIKRPRLHMNVCSVGQAYANAMQQRLRGPGITLNVKMFDTFFQIINSDKQIIIPSNKQRLSKVWVFFHKHNADTNMGENAFRSSVSGGLCHTGIVAGADGARSSGKNCLRSYQFQVGTEVSEAVGLEDSTKNLAPPAANQENYNSGMKYLEAYLRAIGAVNGHEQEKEFWGKDLDPLRCNDWEGGDLLQTFLSKYFCCVYDGEKLLGSNVETGVDTESGKDIVVDLRWAGGAPENATRVMVLIQYHCQVVLKENDVQLSF